jgi:glycosyltransferase involved in cell wall biosynthesis
MRVVLVTAGEPLPTDRADVRLHRTGQFAAWLAARGHAVDWVTNRFDHFQKLQRPTTGTVTVAPNYRIHLLESRGYGRNISVQRFLDHADLGRSFRALAPQLGQADVVLAAMPTIELAAESVRWARAVGAASLVDIRDLWPDIMIERAPAGTRWIARLALSRLARTLGDALRNADGIIGLNQTFVDWGVAGAGRMAGLNDAEIPLGYAMRALSEGDRESAMQFWRNAGLHFTADAPPILAFAGSISSQFDFAPVLAAGDRLRARGIRIVVCGTGERRPDLERAAGSHPELCLPGWCSYAQLRVLFEHAAMGLLPYRDSVNFQNHLPNKAGEYLAHGLPIAWSLGTGPLAQLISDHEVGFSYDMNGERLAMQVNALLDAPQSAESKRAAARALFQAQFDAERVHQRLLEHLTLAARRRSAAA